MSFTLNQNELYEITKAPQAELDYTFDWTDLHGDQAGISTSTWSVDTAGLTVVSDTVSGFTTTVLLSGGEVGEVYVVRNYVVFDSGLKDERVFIMKIEERST